MWKTLGRAHVLKALRPDARLLVVTSNLPRPGSDGDRALRAVGPANIWDAVEMFDRRLATAREAIAAAGDDHLLAPWSLLAGGHAILTMPRVAVLRSMIMNHMIHHRAQLGLYLRLNDLPMPAIYGPSADEQ